MSDSKRPSNKATQMLPREISALVQRLVGKSAGDVLQAADTLRGLADALDGYGDLEETADAARLRHCATGVQALGAQAVLTAHRTLAATERMQVCALVLEKLDEP